MGNTNCATDQRSCGRGKETLFRHLLSNKIDQIKHPTPIIRGFPKLNLCRIELIELIGLI